jgi:hypothetical protein
MVDIEVTDAVAIFEVQGLDKLWAFKSRLEISLPRIRDIRIVSEAARGCGTVSGRAARVCQAWLPPERSINKASASSGCTQRRADVVIELKDDGSDKLLIEVEDPEEAAARLRAAVTQCFKQLGLDTRALQGIFIAIPFRRSRGTLIIALSASASCSGGLGPSVVLMRVWSGDQITMTVTATPTTQAWLLARRYCRCPDVRWPE